MGVKYFELCCARSPVYLHIYSVALWKQEKTENYGQKQPKSTKTMILMNVMTGRKCKVISPSRYTCLIAQTKSPANGFIPLLNEWCKEFTYCDITTSRRAWTRLNLVAQHAKTVPNSKRQHGEKYLNKHELSARDIWICVDCWHICVCTKTLQATKFRIIIFQAVLTQFKTTLI